MLEAVGAGVRSPVYWTAAALLLFGGAKLYALRWRKVKIITVIDGDTFMCIDRQGNKRKLRLKDVDSPEIGQDQGKEAKQFACKHLLKKWVHIRIHGKDRYRRLVAEVRTPEGQCFSRLIVAEGLAYPLKSSWKFFAASQKAKWGRQGVYGSRKRVAPWTWRKIPRILRWLTGKR